MADIGVPVTIGRGSRGASPGKLASSIGGAAAAILSYLIEVVDREDRLESGSGKFKADLAADREAGERAVEDSILRALRMAADPINFKILVALAGSLQVSASDLSSVVSLPRLAVEQRVSDLVSAGLASKVFSSGQIAGTDDGAALVGFIQEAVAAGSTALEEKQ